MENKLCPECQLIEVKPGKVFCGNSCRLKAQKRDCNPLKINVKKERIYIEDIGV
jgi:hypothetical protein